MMSRFHLFSVLLVVVFGCGKSNEQVKTVSPRVDSKTTAERTGEEPAGVNSFITYEEKEGWYSIECPQDWNPQIPDQSFMDGVVRAASPDKQFMLCVITSNIFPPDAESTIDPEEAFKILPTDTDEVKKLKIRMKEQTERERQILETIVGDDPALNDVASIPIPKPNAELRGVILDEISQPIFAGWIEAHQETMLVRPGRSQSGELSGIPAKVLEFESEYLDTKTEGKSWAAACITDNDRLFALLISGPVEQWDLIERVKNSFSIHAIEKAVDVTKR